MFPLVVMDDNCLGVSCSVMFASVNTHMSLDDVIAIIPDDGTDVMSGHGSSPGGVVRWHVTVIVRAGQGYSKVFTIFHSLKYKQNEKRDS